MPNSVVKSYAKKSGKSVAEVEKIWDESKTSADEAFKGKKKEEGYWAYVNAITKKRLQIKESTSFKEYVELSFDGVDNPKTVEITPPATQTPLAVEPPTAEVVVKEDQYGRFISCIFAARDKAHELHLASKSYAQHIALNELYDLLLEFADRMAESYQGKHGLVKIDIPASDVVFTQPCAITFIQALTGWLESDGRSLVGSDAYIINMYEEMIGEVYQIKYKLENLS